MGEMVASRCRQMLLHLEGDVKELELLLGKIEKLLINDGNIRKVMENIRKIMNIVYTIEDVLETFAWAKEEVAFMPSNNKKKKGITRLLRKYFRRGDGVSRRGDGVSRMIHMIMYVVKSMLEEGQPLMKWLHDTFPEVFESECPAVLDRSLAHPKNLQWPRPMYPHDMEDHFVEMKEDLEKLVKLVADQDEKHRVVSIYGVKGLGKTNLARRVYINPEVRNHFKAFAWVSLNQDDQIDDLLQNILNQLAAGAVKKSVEEEEKGVEKCVEKKKEGAQVEEKGAEEKKEGAEEKGSLIKDLTNKVDGEVRKSAEEQEEGVDEKKEGAEVHKKGAEEQEKGAEKKKQGAEEHERGAKKKIEDSPKREKGREEKKVGASMGCVPNKMKKGAVKRNAAEHKKGAEEKKEGVDQKKKGAEEESKSNEETVMEQLKKILRNQRCFIVIDGVLESSQWDYIKSELVIKGGDTKFLLITENKKIAADVGLLHELRCLNDDEGWKLLQKYAFHGKNVPDLGLMPKLGKEMVQQCGGLPSEISRLGRTLSKMSSLSEWHKVNDDVAGYLERAAHQSESNKISYDDPISYDRLPYREKQCFLYLGMFKKDEGVDPEDLSFLWMAEGMVSTHHQLEKNTTDQQLEKNTTDQQLEKSTIMDTTEYYLQKLASVLHVQADELSTNRSFMPLSLRNDLREWSLHLGEREDFRLKVVDFSGGKQPRFDRYILSDGTRRVVIHFNKLSSPVERDLNATEDLRSLLFLNSDREYVNIPVKISDFSEFILLRVLHFVRCKFEGRKLPEGIWKLLNLRYFGVLYCDLDKLPTSITNFRNLQVLNVRSYDDTKMVIPNVISQMKTLKHVRLPSNSDHEQSDKLKLDGLNDLETLDGFNDDIHDLDSVSKLEKLRHLSIRADSNASLESIIKFVKSHGDRIRTKLLIEHTCDLTSPETMPILAELLTSNLNALTFSMVVLPMFPNCGKFVSKHLTQIKLIGCKLREDPMEALGKFPDLRKLCLGYGAFIGTKIDIRDGGFPSLEYLEFRCLPNLEEWNVDEVAMKKISTLIVRKCPVLKRFPYELTSHKTLNNVDIELPPTALPDGCLKIYYRKLEFVKSLNIRKLDPLHSAVVLTKEIEKYKLSG